MWPFRRRTTLGRLGEKLAIKHLRRRGHKILARNYRCPLGEADIIVLDPSTRAETGGETIAFVEVKTRSDDTRVAPESAVAQRKQKQLVRVAEYYLSHHRADDYVVRFDIVTIVLAPSGRPQVRHIPDAFRRG